jgi:uridylate kinase
LIKATRVDGIFDSDPEKDNAAVKFDVFNFENKFFERLEIMGATEFTVCRDNSFPIRVLNIQVAGNLRWAVCGEQYLHPGDRKERQS